MSEDKNKAICDPVDAAAEDEEEELVVSQKSRFQLF